MEDIIIKMKINAIHQDQHSVEVEFYTDNLLASIEPIRVSRTNQLIAENFGTPEQCRLRAEQEYYIDRRNITLPIPAPQGEELMKYLRSHAPREWLAIKEKQLVDPEDMSQLINIIGTEHSISKADLDAELTPPPPPEIISTNTV
jgi:hypothetical protein